MAEKPKIFNVSTVLSAIIVFAIILFKQLFEFSRLGRLQVGYIVLNLAACIALTAFLAVYFLPHVSKEINGTGIIGLLGYIYLIAVNIDEHIIRIDVLIFFIVFSVMMLLVKNIYGLIAVAVSAAVLAFFYWHAVVCALPAVMCTSMIIYAPLFKKAKPVSKKKAKKAAPEPVENKLKEKIIFIVCESVMAIVMVAVSYVYRHHATAFNMSVNYRFYAISVVVAVLLIIAAVFAIKNKRCGAEIIAYLVPVICLPMAAFAEFTMAVDYSTALLFTLLAISSEDCIVREFLNNMFSKVAAKLGAKSEE